MINLTRFSTWWALPHAFFHSLRRSILFLLLCFWLIILILISILGTETGNRWLIQTGISFSPSPITIGKIQGHILSDLKLNHISIQAEGNHIQLHKLHLAWSPWDLLQRHVHIQTLHLEGLNLQLAASQDTASPPLEEIILPNIKLPITFALDDLRIQKIHFQQAETQQTIERVEARISSADQHLQIHHLNLTKTATQTAEIKGKLGFITPHPLKLQVDWNWDENTLAHTAGKLNIIGTAQNYQLQIKNQLDPVEASIPDNQIKLSGKGNLLGFTVQDLNINSPAGKMNITGDLAWLPHPKWDIKLKIKQLKPSYWQTDLTGAIDAKLHIIGQLIAGKPDAKLTVLSQGKIRDYPIHADIQAHYQHETIHLTHAELRSGNNHLTASGSATANSINLKSHVNAADLSQLLPKLKGAIKLNLETKGNLPIPAISAHLTAQNLAWEQYQLADLSANIALQNAAKTGEFKLTAQQIDLPDFPIKQLNLTGKGSQADHQIDLTIDSPILSAALQAQGKYTDKHWQGALQHASLDNPQAGKWHIAAPMQLDLSPQKIEVKNHCWVSKDNRICAHTEFDQVLQKINALIDLKSLNLDLIKAYLPENSQLEGKLIGQLHAQGTLPNPVVKTHIKLLNTRYQVATDQGDLALLLRNSQIDALLNAQTWQVTTQLEMLAKLECETCQKANINTAQWGSIHATAALSQPQQILSKRPLTAKLDVEYPTLNIVSVFAPDIQKVKGDLQAHFQLQGTIEQPEITGKAVVKVQSAKVEKAGLTLKNTRIQLQAEDKQNINILAQLETNTGNMQITGNIKATAAQNWHTDINIKGADLQVLRLSDAEVWISPDLHLKGAINALKLNGTLHVPRARIEIEGVPYSAIKISEDTVLVSSKNTTENSKPITKKLPLALDVKLSLGKAITLKAFGLKTRLTGELNARTPQQKTLTVEGNLNLEEGIFQAYGQDLIIEKGELLFSGNPENPGLNIRAIRRADDGVVAGIKVSGLATDPNITVYSIPHKDSAEALSYLLTGHGLSQSSQGEALKVSDAAWALGMAEADQITHQIALETGLDEVRFAGSSAESSELVLGKYLTPDIYVQYVLGLFTGQGGVQLTYTLDENWSVEGQTGAEQSVDVLYNLERD